MGNVLSNLNIINNVEDLIIGRKRKRSKCEEEENMDVIIENVMNTPKRKKVLNTQQYIYHALFEEGQNSDITVCALGQEFHLHKIYLCQSPYFASMFGGSWVETTKTYINIDIIDPEITINSLKIVFGSLYNCEIILSPLEIVSVLATATVFQLDNLIERCVEVMLETMNPKTSLQYYNASCSYGDKKLQEKCFEWFLVNIMTYYFINSIQDLRHVPIELMTKLIADANLCVIQTEYSVYVMLKYWMYVVIHSSEEACSEQINNYYISRKSEASYLQTDEGRPFVNTFRKLRLQNLISHHMDVESILKDNIVPKDWLNGTVLNQWKKLLKINQNEDTGPQTISDDLFLSTSLRCGRILLTKEKHIWRWTGFHFGVDLLIMIDGNSVIVRRNHRSESEQLLSFQNLRHIVIRITLAKLNDQRQIDYSKTSGIIKMSLLKGEEVLIMNLDENIEYPLILSALILYTSPDDTSEDKK